MRYRVILLTLVVACSGGAPESTPTPAGNPAVYSRIKASTDCAALQQEFDQAEENHDREGATLEQRKVSTSYMEAAEARRQELNCG